MSSRTRRQPSLRQEFGRKTHESLPRASDSHLWLGWEIESHERDWSNGFWGFHCEVIPSVLTHVTLTQAASGVACIWSIVFHTPATWHVVLVRDTHQAGCEVSTTHTRILLRTQPLKPSHHRWVNF